MMGENEETQMTKDTEDKNDRRSIALIINDICKSAVDPEDT